MKNQLARVGTNPLFRQRRSETHIGSFRYANFPARRNRRAKS
jgi:hypothetical protein